MNDVTTHSADRPPSVTFLLGRRQLDGIGKAQWLMYRHIKRVASAETSPPMVPVLLGTAVGILIECEVPSPLIQFFIDKIKQDLRESGTPANPDAALDMIALGIGFLECLLRADCPPSKAVN